MSGRVLTILFGATIAAATGAAAQTRVVVDDLPVLGVHVIGVTAAAAGVGVDSVDLRQRIVAKVTRGGFRVPSQAELEERPEIPRLVLNVGLFTTRDSASVFSVLLELVELVQLKRNGVETHAVGWSEQVLGIAPVRESSEAARDATAALLDLFLAQSRTMALASGAPGAP